MHVRFPLVEDVFACVESCSLQVMGSIHINSLHMVSKVTTGPLMNLHSTIMKGVTVSLQLANCSWVFFLFLSCELPTHALNNQSVSLPLGNSQYSQQQAQYPQGSGQQQPFSQQQYSSQQGYSAQPQAYGQSDQHNVHSYRHIAVDSCTNKLNGNLPTGPGQGASSQYSQYQQGQGQQYGSYRSSQGGPGAQTQRPYAYEQVHHSL